MNRIAGGINEINITMGKMKQEVDALKPLMQKVGDLATRCEGMERDLRFWNLQEQMQSMNSNL